MLAAPGRQAPSYYGSCPSRPCELPHTLPESLLLVRLVQVHFCYSKPEKHMASVSFETTSYISASHRWSAQGLA